MNVENALLEAWKHHQAGDVAAAQRIYQQVVNSDPHNADAWCYLGIALHDRGELEKAVATYERAIAIKPEFPVAFNNMGNSLRQLGRIEAATACFDRAIELDPSYTNALRNRGTAFVWEGQFVEALDSYNQVLALEADDADVHKNIGVIRLLQGDFAGAWDEYEWRLKDLSDRLPKHDRPDWDGSALDGRTILLVSEQGLGDTIQFLRYVAVIKQRWDCRVVVSCSRTLHQLLSTWADIDQLLGLGEAPDDFDTFAFLLSLPRLMGLRSVDDIPEAVRFIEPRPELVTKWRHELASVPGFKIGINWQGNPDFAADQMRSFPLSSFAPLARLDGVQLISLQRGFGTEQLDSCGDRLGVQRLQDVDEHTQPFMDTVAILQNLDLAITADTALAHVAGTLGVPVWVALARTPDWRWLLNRDDSPWYPSVRLFRQTTPRDWAPVFQDMANALKALVPTTDKPFERHRVLTSGFNRMVRAKHGLMLVNRHDVYIGRSLEHYGEYSEFEVEVFTQLLNVGDVAVEVGANIGAHTLPIAKAVGESGAVMAFEPQRVIFQTLCGNIAINSISNVHCFHKALGASAGTIAVPALDYNAENNFGGLSLGGTQSGEPVSIVPLDSMNLAKCDMLKIDAEGMELDVLRGAVRTIQQHRPWMYLENDRQEKSGELIRFVADLGYRLYWHRPPLFNPRNHFGNAENIFGQIVSLNMLCVPNESQGDIKGLEPINTALEQTRQEN